MIVLTLANLKGGSTKTTSAVFGAHVLAERGMRVILADADPQGSALRWHEYAEGFSFPVIKLDTGRLHRDLDGITGDRYDAAVIDTPPLEHHKSIVISALRRATHVLVPCAPTPMEYERLRPTRAALQEAASLRRDDSEPPTGVLLTRTVAGAASTAVWRDAIREDGWRVPTGSVGTAPSWPASSDHIPATRSGVWRDGIIAAVMNRENEATITNTGGASTCPLPSGIRARGNHRSHCA